MRPALTNALTNAIRSAFSYTANEAADAELWVYRLDGVSQYWQLSAPINLIPSDIVEIDFIGGAVSNGFAAFIGTTNFAARFDVDTTKSFLREQGLDATLNGIPVNSGSTQVPESGENKASLTITSSGSLEQLSSIGGSRLMNSPIFNFRVIRNGVVIHEIPLTNKMQGATQLATVGNVNATIINYTEDGWENLEQQSTQVTTSDGLRVVTSDNKLIKVKVR